MLIKHMVYILKDGRIHRPQSLNGPNGDGWDTPEEAEAAIAGLECGGLINHGSDYVIQKVYMPRATVHFNALADIKIGKHNVRVISVDRQMLARATEGDA